MYFLVNYEENQINIIFIFMGGLSIFCGFVLSTVFKKKLKF